MSNIWAAADYEWHIYNTEKAMERRAAQAHAGRPFLQSLYFTPEQLARYDARVLGIEQRLAAVLKHNT